MVGCHSHSHKMSSVILETMHFTCVLCSQSFSFKIRKIKDDVMYFPKGFFPSFFPRIFSKWELPNFAISQAATSQVCPSRKARPPVCSVHSAQPSAYPSRRARPPLQPAAPQMVKPNLWEVATWEIVTWEVALGKMHTGMYPTP